MSGLGETLAGLAAVKRTFSGADWTASANARMAAVGGFGFNPGQLKMLTYVPRGLSRASALVVVLHGCTQGAEAHASEAGWLTLADRYGFAVLAPEQDKANNPNRCFNWFQPDDTARGSGEVASIYAMIGHMIGAHGLDPSRVFVTGLSAGGAMAVAMLAAYPETFAAGAVVSGLPYGAANTVQEALSTMRHATALSGPDLKSLIMRAAPTPQRWPRLTIWQGSADATVAPGNAAAIARQWTALLALSAQPDTREMHGRLTRQRWIADDGAVVVETNTVAGLGHGMALAASGHDPIGQAAPYMIETGISAALEIAKFWDLAPTDAPSEGKPAKTRGQPEGLPQSNVGGVGREVLSTLSNRLPASVTKVITEALTTAGLLK